MREVIVALGVPDDITEFGMADVLARILGAIPDDFLASLLVTVDGKPFPEEAVSDARWLDEHTVRADLADLVTLDAMIETVTERDHDEADDDGTFVGSEFDAMDRGMADPSLDRVDDEGLVE